ncbi:hypothetical protein L596_027312 [Steinernema carpocapsae]|uniref:Single domain-containing protein n=1 Tax=Steinernema carpocapsae TaxID=34508 RepID=A0A4U5M3Y2_STECR|nr:hypothetical protein L596_027312 [Steinernema carpocapsae]
MSCLNTMTSLRLAALFALLCLVSYTQAEESNIIDEVKKYDVFTLKRSALACPLPVVGTQCPESNPLWYFTCCGGYDSNKNFLPSSECCFRLQDWVVVSLVILAVLSVISCFIGFLRCICCGR